METPVPPSLHAGLGYQRARCLPTSLGSGRLHIASIAGQEFRRACQPANCRPPEMPLFASQSAASSPSGAVRAIRGIPEMAQLGSDSAHWRSRLHCVSGTMWRTECVQEEFSSLEAGIRAASLTGPPDGVQGATRTSRGTGNRRRAEAAYTRYRLLPRLRVATDRPRLGGRATISASWKTESRNKIGRVRW